MATRPTSFEILDVKSETGERHLKEGKNMD